MTANINFTQDTDCDITKLWDLDDASDSLEAQEELHQVLRATTAPTDTSSTGTGESTASSGTGTTALHLQHKRWYCCSSGMPALSGRHALVAVPMGTTCHSVSGGQVKRLSKGWLRLGALRLGALLSSTRSSLIVCGISAITVHIALGELVVTLRGSLMMVTEVIAAGPQSVV